MWALRRSSNPIRTEVLNLATFRASCTTGLLDTHTNTNTTTLKHPMLVRQLTSKSPSFILPRPNTFSSGKQTLSSQAGPTSCRPEYDDSERDVDDIESNSESELAGDDENLEDELENELRMDTDVKGEGKISKMSDLGKLILDEWGPFVWDLLDRYVADGKDLSRAQIYDALLQLRRFKLYGKALQLSEWLEKKHRLEFKDRDYASRVDLIAKVRGINKAENYLNKIPGPHKKELVYRTLLANCVSLTNMKKAESVFNKMKDLGLTITAFSCNQLLLLYKRTNKSKIADVLRIMEKENIKPTIFTYQLLIDTKGLSNDVVGMDQIVKTMKAQGVEPSVRIKALLARHYVIAGLRDRAKVIVEEFGGLDLKANRWICPVLFPVYAELGRADEVVRLWEVCQQDPRDRESLAAIGAFGKVQNIEKAEEIFEQMMSKSKRKVLQVSYTVMLKAYADNKMLVQGKEVVKRMVDHGCEVGPITLDAIVKMFVKAGEVEKADSILQKFAQKRTKIPLFGSYMAVLDWYADNGDVHNSEKVFYRLREVGYTSRARAFRSLLRAYMTAKVPAYGFRERMKADGLIPNRGFNAMLGHVDVFWKSVVSDSHNV